MRRLRLLCDVNPMAYGSAASLASVLAALRVDAEITAMGRDASLEFLRGHQPATWRTIELDVKAPREVAAFVARETPDAALVVSNHANLRCYADAGLPVFFIDILFWYGEQKDEAVWSGFQQGFAVNFPGVRERIRSLNWRTPPEVVGPLLRRLPQRAVRPRGTLVNLGGVRSLFMTPDRARAGLSVVAHVLRSLAHLLPPGDVTVATGADAAALLAPQLPACMRVGHLTARDYDARLMDSALLLTVPGLNAVLEGMAASVPLAFLPALNPSQCLQLRCYQQAGVGAPDLELDRYAPLEMPHRVDDERTLTDAVIAALWRVACSADALGQLAGAVGAQLPVDGRLDARRRDFVNTLGLPGASVIARAITRWWEGRHA